MSVSTNIYLTVGVLIVMLITSMVSVYYTQIGKQNAELAKQQSEKNNKDIDKLSIEVNSFIDKWEKRLNVSNSVNNASILRDHAISSNILGNLTHHRIIANLTYAEIKANQKQIEQILNSTDALTDENYVKLAEQRVNHIIGNMTQEHKALMQDHKLIMQLLGNTNTTH